MGKFLALRKKQRNRLFNASFANVSETKQLHLLRRAEEKVHTLACKNAKLSRDHCKGKRRKVQRQGQGKCFSLISIGEVEEAYELAKLDDILNWDQAQEIQEIPMCIGTASDKRFMRFRLSGHSSQKSVNAFINLRASILQRHGAQIHQILRSCTRSYTISPTPLSTKLQSQFLAACSVDVEQITPGFHGTSICNYTSIFHEGLLIPGVGNNIKVANGSAHGNGVYVAKITNPWLSAPFARGASQMLICAVVDDSVAMNSPQQVGALTRHRQSSNVHHVGDAMVVFDARRVAPLFIANWGDNETSTSNCHAASVNAGVAHCRAGPSRSRTAARKTFRWMSFDRHRY